ncbi:MAG: hypothetical protein STHCBS139747_004729 [Sporothrix thermara]
MVYEEEVGAASPQISKTYAIEHTNVKPEPDVELKAVNDNFEENSPGDGVRMTVPTTDQDVPASTFRAWLLGIIFTIVTNGLKQLFTMHNPPNKFTVFGHSFSLKPGPFNYKEHTIITIMIIGTSSFNANATAIDITTVFIKFFGMSE